MTKALSAKTLITELQTASECVPGPQFQGTTLKDLALLLAVLDTDCMWALCRNEMHFSAVVSECSTSIESYTRLQTAAPTRTAIQRRSYKLLVLVTLYG